MAGNGTNNYRAVFSAVFVTCRQVRDEIQFIFTVPAEKGTEYLEKIGGFPKPGESRWCAIARLDQTKEDQPQELHKTSSRQTLGNEPARPHNPYSRRAGILSNDPLFQKWVVTPDVNDKAAYAASIIRSKCGVTSRKDILPGTDAALRFDLLQSAFCVWRDGPKHGAEAS